MSNKVEGGESLDGGFNDGVAGDGDSWLDEGILSGVGIEEHDVNDDVECAAVFLDISVCLFEVRLRLPPIISPTNKWQCR